MVGKTSQAGAAASRVSSEGGLILQMVSLFTFSIFFFGCHKCIDDDDHARLSKMISIFLEPHDDDDGPFAKKAFLDRL